MYSVDRCITPRHCNTIVSLMPKALLHRVCFRLVSLYVCVCVKHSSGAIKAEILIEFHRDEQIEQTRIKRAISFFFLSFSFQKKSISIEVFARKLTLSG